MSKCECKCKCEGTFNCNCRCSCKKEYLVVDVDSGRHTVTADSFELYDGAYMFYKIRDGKSPELVASFPLGATLSVEPKK